MGRLGTMEAIRRVTAPDVGRTEPGLEEDAGRQVAPLTDLAIGGDLTAAGDLAEPSAKLVHGDVHGSGDMALTELSWRANV